MIATVTFNPSIDKTATLPTIITGGLNRLSDIKWQIGGKGINVARVIDYLDVAVLPITLSSTVNGNLMEAYLQKHYSRYCLVAVDQPIRTNLKLIGNGIVTEINEPGPLVSEEKLIELTKLIKQELQVCEWLVLSGSTPPGIDPTIYHHLVLLAKKQGVKVLLDADDTLLSEGIKAGPTVLKPNRYEMEKLFHLNNATNAQLIVCAQSLLNEDLQLVVISLGAEGALFVSKQDVLQAVGPEIAIVSTVGAGDAMVAAIVVGLSQNQDLATIAKMSMTSATVLCNQPANAEHFKQLYQQYYDIITIYKINQT
jgi:1-phosphofructokinase